MRPAIILFAKAPVPGRVKTRLQPPLTASQASVLHIAFVRDMLGKLRAFNDFADIELHTDIFTDAWPESGVTCKLQCAGDLQLKLFHALENALRQGREQVIVFGSDSPTLPSRCVLRLLRSEADVALGPCEDGGYYAIACRRVSADMFQDVAWSTRDALAQTAGAARKCGLSVEIGELWWDVDEPADLNRLMSLRDLPPHTAEAVLNLGSAL